MIATIAMLNQNANVPEEELEDTLCEVKPNDTATDAPSSTRAEGYAETGQGQGQRK